VRWRGCLVGCLDFLGGAGEDENGSVGQAGDSRETDGLEGQLQDVVTLVNFAQGGLDDAWVDWNGRRA
jgi:hypothetical protein